MGFSSPCLRLNLSQTLNPYKTLDEIPSRSLFAIPPRYQNPRFSRVSARASINGRGCDSLTTASRKIFIRRKLVFRTRASEVESKFPEEDGQIEVGRGRGGQIAVGSAITVVLAVVNRVLYKLALVPMKEYPFFMAQVTTFG